MNKKWLILTIVFTTLFLAQRPTAPALGKAANPAAPTGSAWQQIQKLLPTLIEDEESLGESVALAGDTLAVANYSGDRVHVYTRAGALWQEAGFLERSTPTPLLAPLDVATDGETIVVGYQEVVYVYQKPATGWQTMTETAVLTASDNELNDDFGTAVAVDGDTIVVGAPLDRYGPPAGSYGAAYVFVQSGGTWSTASETAKLTADNAGSLDNFGISVAIAGNTIAIGSRGAEGSTTNAGGVYIFTEPPGGWVTTSNDAAFLTDSDGELGAGLGVSVAINSDATVVAAGEYRDEEFISQGGAINVFVRPGGGWTDMSETAKLTPATPIEGENLGRSVAIWGDTIIGGANGLDDFIPGATYIFERPSGGWADSNETQRLVADDNTEGDAFGTAVAMGDDLIAVGSPFRQAGEEEYTGAVYLFSTTAVTFDHAVYLPAILK